MKLILDLGYKGENFNKNTIDTWTQLPQQDATNHVRIMFNLKKLKEIGLQAEESY